MPDAIAGAGRTDATDIWAGSLAVANPWIEHRVRQIDHKVEQHVNRGRQQDDRLDDREILGQDRAYQQAADPLPGEYRLDDDMRVGAAYHHMSNGKALGQSTNPGTEVVGVTFSIALH